MSQWDTHKLETLIRDHLPDGAECFAFITIDDPFGCKEFLKTNQDSEELRELMDNLRIRKFSFLGNRLVVRFDV